MEQTPISLENLGAYVLELESRLLRAETIITVLQRALGWRLIIPKTIGSPAVLLGDRELVVQIGDTPLTESERKILESGNE